MAIFDWIYEICVIHFKYFRAEHSSRGPDEAVQAASGVVREGARGGQEPEPAVEEGGTVAGRYGSRAGADSSLSLIFGCLGQIMTEKFTTSPYRWLEGHKVVVLGSDS